MPGLDQANLGPYPILQLAAAILVLMGVGIAVWRGLRDKDKSEENDPDRLQYQLDQAQLQANVARVLEANREAFFKAMSDQERAINHDIGDLEDRLRTLEIEHAGFRERLGRRPR